MTTSPHHGRGPRSRRGGTDGFDGEPDLLVQESAPHRDRDSAYPPTDHPDSVTDHQAADRGTEYVTTPGIPGRGVVLLTAMAAGGCAALDFALTGGLTIFFDLCFVVICLVAAMAVRRHDVFAAGVLPPLVFAGVIATIALLRPTVFIADGDLSKVFLTGLAAHADALVAGYAVALLTVGGRVASSRKR